jgi:hypothetical protein
MTPSRESLVAQFTSAVVRVTSVTYGALVMCGPKVGADAAWAEPIVTNPAEATVAPINGPATLHRIDLAISCSPLGPRRWRKASR